MTVINTQVTSRYLIAVIFFLGITCSFLGITCSVIAQVPMGFSTTPSFDEEFNGTSLDMSKWAYRGLGVRNGCTVTASAVKVANGYARVSVYTANNSSGTPTQYCGAITTDNIFEQKYGYWEANLRFNYQSGMQTSFWIQSDKLGSIIGNPQQSGVEMDVFEHAFDADSTTYDHALHWNGYGIYHTAIGHHGTLSTLNGSFHTWGIAWTPGRLTFYVDGKQTWTQAASDSAISDYMEYAIADTEIPNASKVPSDGYGALGSSANASLDVDYVRIYPYSSATTSKTLSPIADAFVQDGSSAGTNFGTQPTLYTKKDATGYNRNSYLMFDLSSVTGTVEKATLYLTPTSMGEKNIRNTINYVPNNSWTETGITWNNQPAISGALSTGLNYDVNILTNYDTSTKIKAGQKFSVQVAPDTPTGSAASVVSASRENSTKSYRPVLTIVTTP